MLSPRPNLSTSCVTKGLKMSNWLSNSAAAARADVELLWGCEADIDGDGWLWLHLATEADREGVAEGVG